MDSKASKKKFINISSMDFLGAIKPRINKVREKMSKDTLKNRTRLTLRANSN